MTISVIMTCHNESAYIGQAVRSVAAQTRYDEVGEIIVVNDGSTDNSAEVLAGLMVEIPKLRVIERPGVGLPAARNAAIRDSTNDFLAFLDGDDYWVADKIERQLPALFDPRVGLVYCDYFDFAAPDASDSQFISAVRYPVDDSHNLAGYFVHDGPIMPSTTIIRRAVFDDVGLFDEALRIGEDNEMFLRIAERWRFQHVPGGLFYKRRHGGNITSRLDRLLPISERLTKVFIARNPELAPLSGKRMSRRYARTGNDCIQHGNFRLGTKYLGQAIASDPLFWRPYAYLLLALVPSSLSATVRRGLRKAFHRSRAVPTIR